VTLPVRPLGTSGLSITTVGFGAWAVGGGGWAYGWGPQDDALSLAAMRRALELGINWIDTAAVYGLGHSEEVVGRLLRELPAAGRPLVFTKCGLRWDERDRMAEPRRVLRPESIRAECEASLRRLGVERIDLYQFHWPDQSGTAVEDSWAEMTRLVEEGKVRAAGVSNFDSALLARCEALRHVDSLQPGFSMIRRGVAAGELPCVPRTAPLSSLTARCNRGCSPTASARRGSPPSPRMTGVPALLTSGRPHWTGISRSGMPSGPSRSATAPRSRRWPWPGCSPGPV
jgi:aryl-alcohol dehydrogenase-like predicted oxidoreductase